MIRRLCVDPELWRDRGLAYPVIAGRARALGMQALGRRTLLLGVRGVRHVICRAVHVAPVGPHCPETDSRLLFVDCRRRMY